MPRFEDFTVKELRAKAKTRKLRGYSSFRKADLIKLLRRRVSPKKMRRKRSRSRSRRRCSSRRRSSRRRSHSKKITANQYFDKIFVINLKDQPERLVKIKKRAKRAGISFSRFDAVDGRCDKKTDACAKKRVQMEKKYKVTIPKKMTKQLGAASLTIGTILILREQVKNEWDRVLIMEDDATFVGNFRTRFNKGIHELAEVAPDWDLLYLGCGTACGSRYFSKRKSKRAPYKTSLSKYMDANFYVSHKDDLRVPCDPEDCVPLSPNLSIAPDPGATYGYAVSLKGAKKILKIFNDRVSNHIDQLLMKNVRNGKLKAISFDPPIINHYGGADRADSTIDWKW